VPARPHAISATARSAVRHVSGDRIVAMVEVVSPGKRPRASRRARSCRRRPSRSTREFTLLILDLLPRAKRDPGGIHGEIWHKIAGSEYDPPADKPLTLAAYETGDAVRAYVVSVAVGDNLPDMPLFMAPGKAVAVPLGATYGAAFVDVPRRWRRVLETPTEPTAGW
jgi:hypothetical protein